jgi:hypothetical protein
MEILHRAKQPQPPVLDRILKRRPERLRLLRIHQAILRHAALRQLALLRTQPTRRRRRVGQEEETQQGGDGGGSTLDDEHPAPAGEAATTVQALKDAGGDEVGEAEAAHLRAIEDSDAGGDLFSRVEDAEDIESARVELRETLLALSGEFAGVNRDFNTYRCFEEPKKEPTGQ